MEIKKRNLSMLVITVGFALVCFRVFDSDGDGFLSRSEIELMCKALIEIRKENVGEKVRLQVMFLYVILVDSL